MHVLEAACICRFQEAPYFHSLFISSFISSLTRADLVGGRDDEQPGLVGS